MTPDTDVLIVGGGPTGLLMAHFLGLRGFRAIVVEKQPQPYDLPRAVHFDGEVMRILQAARLAGRVRPQTLIGKGMLFQDAGGNTLVDWSRARKIGATGWHESYRFHQPTLEKNMRNGLRRFGRVVYRQGVGVTGLSDTGGNVIARLSDGSALTARFAVAADGAQSSCRELLGIDLIDLGFEERWLVIDVRLKRPRPDLGDYSIQHCDANAPATYVRSTGNRRRWEMRLPADRTGDHVSDDEVWAGLARWITPKDAELERAVIYTFRSRLAETWQRGRIFLAGDAAHQMPPFMGQGMCAGMRDVANLEWKLALVLAGGDPSLLQSYETERAANARAFIDLSVRLGRLINQTAAGAVPAGRMKSIWPALGPGLGRPGAGVGEQVPQALQRGPDGVVRSDDISPNGFYLMARDDTACGIPVWRGAEDWLKARGLSAVLVRPDGHGLLAIPEGAAIIPALRPFVPMITTLPDRASQQV